MIDYTPLNRWIWRQGDWPEFQQRLEQLHPYLGKTIRNLGVLLGRMGSFDCGLNSESALNL